MTGVAAPSQPKRSGDRVEQPGVVDEVGATLFSDLVWAHYWWERDRWEGDARSDRKEAYDKNLEAFRRTVGEITHVYWSTRGASAVAMSEKRKRTGSLLRETDDVIQLHRVTDWVVRDTPGVANLLHECDALAIRVGEILRGPSERIAMRWILCVQEYLLGFFERVDDEPPEAAATEELVASKRAELERIEQYYRRAAGQAGRIVYFTGMLIGMAIVALIAAAAAGFLAIFGVWTSEYAPDVGMLFLCFAAGAVGALVSVMYRLRPGGSFSLDVEVGRPLVRRLGVFRPFVGATFGLLVYAMLASGVLLVQTSTDRPDLYFAVAAFFAGFSERWVHVAIHDAEDQISGTQRSEKPVREDGAPEIPLDENGRKDLLT